MANKTPPARTNNLHTPAGVTPPASEATALAAGDTIIVQNNGNTIIRVAVTLAGTATVQALNPANNQAVTLSTPETLIGPLDPAVFGSTVSITTATATGSVGLYALPARKPNPLCNPFETDGTKQDSP